MGMAIREPSGQVAACLSLAAVESRMQRDREPALVALLAREVERVEQRLAGDAMPQPQIAPAARQRIQP